jgi:hypothetical protein
VDLNTTNHLVSINKRGTPAPIPDGCKYLPTPLRFALRVPSITQSKKPPRDTARSQELHWFQEAAMSLRRSSHTSSADETLEDELLRAIERDIQENARATSSAQQSPSSLVRGAARRAPGVATSPSDHFLPTRRSPPRSPHRGRRRVAGMVLTVAANHSDHTLPTWWSPPRSPHRGQASSRVPGTSGSAPRVTARTGSEEEARLQQDQAAHKRSGYAARKRSALAKIPVGSDDQEQPPFAKMEGPMTGLMELTNGIEGLPNPPELPGEPSTRWSHEDVSPTPYLSSWDFYAVFQFCF